MRKLLIIIFAVLNCMMIASAKELWKITPKGSLVLEESSFPHSDHIEMSGKEVSVVLRYGVTESGSFTLNKSVIWPLLRTNPDNTHASLMRRFNWDPLSLISVNNVSLNNEKVSKILLDGTLRVESHFNVGWKGSCKVLREYTPSVDKPSFLESYYIINTTKHLMKIEIPEASSTLTTAKEEGVDGEYHLISSIKQQGTFNLNQGDTLRIDANISGYKSNQSHNLLCNQNEFLKRRTLVDSWASNLILETPDPVINHMFAFSKIRASESIYETSGGPMHGPGGESFYAAIWANDQAEYINPYFPFLGYEYGNQSALNSFKHFAKFMNSEWKPIPSSIISEGKDIWNGAGDRGDAAMIAYGAARYALARGSKEEAEQLWPLIQWCLDFCKRKLNNYGVVMSDSDELEGRFPAGDANLCTSSLYYDALLSASMLSKELNKGRSIAKTYQKEAENLRKAINSYFSDNIEGFETYAYFKGNDRLRSWICIPLSVGITERSKGTVEALFSPKLWTKNGLLTQSGTETFWDRSTLYALRGIYTIGETEKATSYLHDFSKMRLLGDHVPYAIEAWPEGGQRHLSAESGLYGRIVTEGLFGIRPTGLKSFSLTPRLPRDWDKMSLRKIRAFDAVFDITVERIAKDKRLVIIKQNNKTYKHTIKKDETVNFRLL